MFSIARRNFAVRLSRAALSGSIFALFFIAALGGIAFAQERTSSHAGVATPLSDLLAEAEKNNPQIEAARHGWEAAQQVPTQVRRSLTRNSPCSI
jgi:hypothetical protein